MFTYHIIKVAKCVFLVVENHETPRSSALVMNAAVTTFPCWGSRASLETPWVYIKMEMGQKWSNFDFKKKNWGERRTINPSHKRYFDYL
jgi:hypothetical protein